MGVKARHHGSRSRFLWRLLAVQVIVSLLAGACAPWSSKGPIRLLYPLGAASATPSPTWAPTITPTPTGTVSPTATMTPRPTETPTPTPMPLAVTVRLDGAQVAQGHTVVVRVSTSQSCRLSGQILERELGFVPLDGHAHVAFLGVAADAEVGPQLLRVTARAEGGQQAELVTALEVVAGDYGSQTLHLSAKIARLLAPEIAEPELRRLAPIYATFTPHMLWDGPFDWPIKGPVTSGFGTRRSYSATLRSYHTGMDIDGETGDIIRAPARGVVRLAEALQVRGNAVILDHGAGVLSGYYHLSEIQVRLGQVVERGQVLGAMGGTGLATGSHLHWELRVGGIPVQPIEWTERSFP